ncbi:unnamed protein product [Allacma fusca]|uniref:DDE Tnp4 domain-containing protein n=1 Tax=Allacma fusca TaxID=39272 RepID=A0A8J2JSC0_9HEXA|nr:unnamed protein product [Allacma fusca]
MALHFPEEIVTKHRIKFSAMEGLCILLRRLCYPNRLSDLVKVFNRDISSISRIYLFMLNNIYSRYGHLLRTLKQFWLSPKDLENFCQVCYESGSVLPNICGFIDGTARPICRPTLNQKEQYSGYKKEHCLKYQSVVFPNGLIGRLDGPFNGRRHDAAILHLSGLIKELKEVFVNPDGTWYRLYGDPGYTNSKFINVGYTNKIHLTRYHKIFNKCMSELRVSVEYGFGKILQLFAFNDFKKNNKLLLQPLKKQYIVSALLANCHTCLRGSQVSMYFKVDPPCIYEYLNRR